MARDGDIPPIALTMGEPAGICGEITLKAWRARRHLGPSFFAIGDPDYFDRAADYIQTALPVAAIDDPEAVEELFPEALPVLPLHLAAEVTPGRPDPENGPAVIAAIERAVTLVQQGQASALVTNPIHKESLYSAGFHHPGHTEFLGALAGPETQPVMMLACPELRVVPVTVHVPLAEALSTLSRDRIVVCAKITAAALTRDFGILDPDLAVAAINPHAGEGGHLGSEEIEIIGPAIETLQEEGIRAHGPMPADSLFHPRARSNYDAVLCMYHDQALIPLKTIDFEGGVNITLGLPFVRTSPDHGTGLDIAGTGTANEANLIAALLMAHDLAARRIASQPERASA